MRENGPVVTVEDQLAKMREGYKLEMKLKLGGLEIPCRLLSSAEETNIIANAKTGLKVPHESMRDIKEAEAVMKATLAAACTVDNTPYASPRYLDEIMNTELTALYDQYMTLTHSISPEFEKLSIEQITEIVRSVKKKERSAKDLFTWQRAAIGDYFLETILPAVKEAGS